MTKIVDNVSRSLLRTSLHVALAAFAIGVHASDRALDRTLIDSLTNKDIEAARRALDAGANPQAVLGGKLSDSAMCMAIDDRGTAYLELLIDYGASPDMKVDEGSYTLRTPLSCAIDLYNPAAFELLLAKGADPDADLCVECEPRFRHSALTEALVQGKYPMALTLVEVSTVDEGEMEALLFTLENTPYDSFHPWSAARRKLIDWVREQGVSIDPMPGDPVPPGYDVPDCLHSVRDMEEGLEKGTICH